MPTDLPPPGYQLADELTVTTPTQLRAVADPLRAAILDLLLERAATVTDLATAVGRPKGTVAHHVNVLVAAGLLRVVSTRRVRAVEERSYGRTARLFRVGALAQPAARRAALAINGLATAAAEAVAAHEADDLRCGLRHARLPPERAAEFWERVVALLHEFAELPRAGDTVYGFAVGLYPTDHPTLPAD